MTKINRTVNLQYFKQSGKLYTSDSYQTKCTMYHETVKELKEMLCKGENPGLNEFAVQRNAFYVHADIPIGIEHQLETGDYDTKVPSLFIPGKDFPIIKEEEKLPYICECCNSEFDEKGLYVEQGFCDDCGTKKETTVK